MESFCRACLVKCDKPSDLLQYTEKNRRLYVYSTGIQVKRTDNFPFQVCQECYMNMKLACKFKKQCRLSEKRLNHYLALKDCGEVTDLTTYMKNNDDFLTVKFPTINGYGTPMQKYNDDNESTNTSIRNFMKDLLQPDEIQDTEARIIKEVIEEEADILEDSLDSHWLQDDVSVDTDFRFSFSPFATPRTDRISKTPNPTPVKTSPEPKSDHEVNIDNESFIAAKKLLLYSTPAKDMGVKIENVEANLIQNTEVEIVKGLDSFNDFGRKDTIDNNLEQAINCADVETISLSEILASPQMRPSASGGATPATINSIAGKTSLKTILATLPICPGASGRSTPAGINPTDVEKISLSELLATSPIRPSSTGGPALAEQISDVDKIQLNDNIMATPPIHPGASGASTPTIANILFGKEIEMQDENCVLQKAGHVIEHYENVEGNDEDVLQDFFNKETGEYIGEHKEEVPEVFEVNSNYEENDNVHKEVNTESKGNNGVLKRAHVGKRPELMGKSKYDLSDFSCKICNKTYKDVRVLKIHLSKMHKLKLPAIRTKEPLEEITCEYCGKIFKRRSNFLQHKQRHLRQAENKVHKCEYCSLEYSTEARLRMHMTTHIGKEALKPIVKKHVCTVCGHSSGSTSNLRIHMMRHNKSYLFECDQCNRKFYRKTDLITHVRSHINERPFKCMQCEKCFSRRDALSRHMKVHNKERIYKCTFCNTTSITQSGLNHHMENSKKCLKLREIAYEDALKMDQNKEFEVLETIVSKTLKEMDIEVEENLETTGQSEDKLTEGNKVTDDSGVQELLSLL